MVQPALSRRCADELIESNVEMRLSSKPIARANDRYAEAPKLKDQ
jgi:hypothetical protein